jgi:hypothetical protein
MRAGRQGMDQEKRSCWGEEAIAMRMEVRMEMRMKTGMGTGVGMGMGIRGGIA